MFKFFAFTLMMPENIPFVTWLSEKFFGFRV
jgi:hypothetical protein